MRRRRLLLFPIGSGLTLVALRLTTNSLHTVRARAAHVKMGVQLGF